MKFATDPYDLNEFFVKPTDERGHGPKLNARVPPDLARLVEVIVSSRKFPYRTESDFFRDAVWRLAGYLAPQIEAYEGTTILAKLMAAEESLKVQEAGEKLLQVIESLGQRLMALDSPTERKRLVGKIESQMAQVKEDYWRERALRLLKERYGEYL